MKKSFGDKIYIEWADSVEQKSWRTIEEAIWTDDNEWVCKTNAYYVGRTKDIIIIAHTISIADNSVIGVLKIPRRSILKVR